jgi:hypothetical protein
MSNPVRPHGLDPISLPALDCREKREEKIFSQKSV